MAKPKVFVTRKVPQQGIDILQKNCDVDMWGSEDLCPRAELLNRVKGVQAIFCTISDKIDKEVLDHAGKSLKVVATMSVGMLHINVRECEHRKIQVTNTPDVATDCAAELTMALLLMTTRRVLEGVYAVKNGEWGKWKPMWLCGIELVNRTVGILGFGRVGFGVARRLKPFGVGRIIYHDARHCSEAEIVGATFVSMDDILHQSDIICICCALTPQTRHLFNKTTFKKMKKEAILINTARGEIVHTDDLVHALKTGMIAAAGLDVTDPEPLPKDHALVSMNNCVILPHFGTNTMDARINMSINTARNIVASLEHAHA